MTYGSLKEVFLFGTEDFPKHFLERKRLDPDQFNSIVVFPNTLLNFELHGKKAILLSDFVDKNEIDCLFERAYKCAVDWTDPFKRELHYMGIDLGECITVYMFLFFLALLAAHSAIHNLIKKCRPKAIYLITRKQKGIPQLYHIPLPVLEKVVPVACRENGISFRKFYAEQENNAWISNFMAMAKIYIKRTDFYPLVYRFLRRRKKPPFSDLKTYIWKKESGAARILGFGEGGDSAIVGSYIKYLDKDEDKEALLVTETAEISTNRSGLVFDPAIKRVSFGFDKVGCYPKALEEARKRFRSCTWKDEDCNLIARYTLRGTLQEAWVMLEDVARWLPTCKRLFDEVCPSHVLITHLGDHRLRALVQIAKMRKCITIGIPHGFMDILETYDFQGNYLAVWGDHFKGIMAGFTSPETQPFVVPALNLWQILPDQRKLSSPNTQYNKIMNNKPEGTPVQILLLCTGFYVNLISDMKSREFLDTWELLFQFASCQPNILFKVKSNPSKNYESWLKAKISQRQIKNITICQGVRLEDVLSSADLVVDLGKPGTGSLLAMLFQKPIVFCNYLTRINRPARKKIFNTKGFNVVENSMELIHTIERFIESPWDHTQQENPLRGFFDFTLSPERELKQLVDNSRAIR